MDNNLHDEQFDELLRSKYQDEEIVPPDMLWKGIRKGLYQEKVQSPDSWYAGVLWTAAGIAALITGFIIYFSFSHQDKADVKKEYPQMVIEKKSNDLQIEKTNPPVWLKKKKQQNESFPEKKNMIVVSEDKSSVLLLRTSKPLNADVLPAQASTVSNTGLSANEKIQKLTGNGIPLSVYSFFQKDSMKGMPSLTSSTSILLNKKIENPVSEIPDKTKRERRFSVELLAKPMVSFRFLTDNPSYPGTEFNKSYFNKRDKYAITFGYGLQFAYQINPRISLKLGLSMSNYASHFSTDYSAVMYNGKYEADIYTSSGLASIHIISSDTISKEDLLKSSINISYFNIPVGINYSFAKFFYLGAGLNFGFNIGQEMNWDATDYQGTMEIQTEKIQGVEKFIVGLSLEAGVKARIYKNLSFSAAPVFQFNVMTINNSSFGVENRQI